MKRRAFINEVIPAATSYFLLDAILASSALRRPIQLIVHDWIKQLDTYCRDLKKTTLSCTAWQEKTEALFDRLPLADVLRLTDFDRLKKGMELPDLGVATRPVHFPRLEGLPENTAFVKKIFGMQKDRAIIPHGHSNMASAHLILQGQLHVRHFEKVADENSHLIVRPTVDTAAGPGTSTSVSDEKDNVHWFVAQSDAAYTFDVIVLDLNEKSYDIHNLDMAAAEDLHDGRLRAPVIDTQTALRKYGKGHH